MLDIDVQGCSSSSFEHVNAMNVNGCSSHVMKVI